jgi:hypothetical protein
VTRRVLLAAAAAGAAGCGYRVSGQADLLPTTIRTIAIPAFENLTTRYRLTESLPGAITREFISRTRYAVTPEPEQADAVLRGAVTNYAAYPSIIDQASGRAAGVQVHVTMQVTLVDRAGATLFSRPHMEFRQRYEISTEQLQYFEESSTALDRLSRDVARTVVSAVLEGF